MLPVSVSRHFYDGSVTITFSHGVCSEEAAC